MGKSDNKFRSQANEQRQANLLELKTMLSAQDPDKDFVQKVINYAERYDLPVSYVWDKLYLSDDDLELYGFEKDPGRQNIFEVLQLKAVQSLPVIEDAHKMPSSGKDARYVIQGKVVPLTKTEKDRFDVKSIDFYWHYELAGKRIEFYTSCKYTHEAGGAQDNQKSDVNTSFLREAKVSEDTNIFFIALLDGEYYKLADNTGLTKMDQLNNTHCGKRCKAVDMDNLPALIRDILIEWIEARDDISEQMREDEIQRITEELS